MIFDVWIIGDGFLHEVVNSLFDMRKTAITNHTNPLYLYDYYNVFTYVPSPSMGATRTIACTFNAAVEGLNNKRRLPRFVIVIVDKDIIEDVNIFEYGASKAIFKNVEWLVRQINIHIKRKRLEVLETKPGAVYTSDPKIVFVTMIRCPVIFDLGSCMEKVVALRSKFNAILNELAEKFENLVLNVEYCQREHFDFFGRLNTRGKISYWRDINHQLERFDEKKAGAELLP